MKKICVVFNHFQIQDGIARAAIGMANELVQEKDVEITLRPLFKCDQKMKSRLLPGVKLEPFFGFYFQGFAKLVDLIPDRLLYKLVFRKKYDVEIGYCMTLPIKIVGASTRDCVHYAWMHGYDNGLTLRSYYEKMDKVICVSRCAADQFAMETNRMIPVDYCYNLVNDEVVTLMGNEPIDFSRTEDVTFACVGRHEPGKGYMRMVECVSRLKREGYRLKLWLIGDGPQHADLKRRAAELDAEDDVVFLGEQRNPHAYTAKADVFVCPSFSEGYSTACTEAIMLGVPVLTTDVGGAREIIEDAQSGMVVGMEDEDIYRGMKQILDHPEMVPEWKKTLSHTKNIFSRTVRAEKLKKTLGIYLHS